MAEVTRVADGVWRVAGDFRKAMNVFLIEDDGGVTMYDAATKGMVKPIRKAADDLGGLKRIVLGHAHHDHRGSAPGLGVPVYCHADEVAAAESDGGYETFDIDEIPWWFSRAVYPTLLKRIWDGGPVKIAGTVAEGDGVAGFKVVHFPGHARGLIGLWRESDRLALVSDTIYQVNSIRLKPLPEDERPMVPHPVWAHDYEQSIASVRKLAALGATTVWPGHEDALEGTVEEVRAKLERAADRAAAEPGT
jgi:glyoxylase-like metal-dependent hydrolase (beta-lactamase superfamily II)